MNGNSMVLSRFEQQSRKLIAILRGIRPEETADVVAALVEAGITIIEVPLNSPDPFRSIGNAVSAAPDHCVIGAGTVLEAGEVETLSDVGGQLVISPNVDAAVIKAAKAAGMISMPGVFTPTEALAALKAGADALKFFPANLLGVGGINAIRAVLPSNTMVGAVGGISHEDFAHYMKAGIMTFGMGSSLYKPGMGAEEIFERARTCVAAHDAAQKQVSEKS